MTGYEQLTIEEFDRLTRAKQFAEGPHISTFGDGHGQPYCPDRNVWGTLKDGRRVCSVKPSTKESKT